MRVDIMSGPLAKHLCVIFNSFCHLVGSEAKVAQMTVLISNLLLIGLILIPRTQPKVKIFVSALV